MRNLLHWFVTWFLWRRAYRGGKFWPDTNKFEHYYGYLPPRIVTDVPIPTMDVQVRPWVISANVIVWGPCGNRLFARPMWWMASVGINWTSKWDCWAFAKRTT